MKLRVVQTPKGNFIPQYLDENDKFGPTWRECHLTNNLSVRIYWDKDVAIDICKKYAEKNPDNKTVWEDEM